MKNLDNIGGYGYSPAAEAVYEAGADFLIVKECSGSRRIEKCGYNCHHFPNKEHSGISSIK